MHTAEQVPRDAFGTGVAGPEWFAGDRSEQSKGPGSSADPLDVDAGIAAAGENRGPGWYATRGDCSCHFQPGLDEAAPVEGQLGDEASFR
jgi:hypothetical protein